MAGQFNPQAQQVHPTPEWIDEQIKLHVKHLARLFHTLACMRIEDRKCTLPFCKAFKILLRHMNICRAGKTCKYSYCILTKRMCNHWHRCRRLDCRICMSIRNGTAHIPWSPDTLKYICKKAIHNIIGSDRIEECVDSLELPVTVKAYLRRKSKNSK